MLKESLLQVFLIPPVPTSIPCCRCCARCACCAALLGPAGGRGSIQRGLALPCAGCRAGRRRRCCGLSPGRPAATRRAAVVACCRGPACMRREGKDDGSLPCTKPRQLQSRLRQAICTKQRIHQQAVPGQRPGATHPPTLAHTPQIQIHPAAPPEALDRGSQQLQSEGGAVEDGHTVQAVLGGLLPPGKLEVGALGAGKLQQDLLGGD